MLISKDTGPINPLNLQPGDLLFSERLHNDLQDAVFGNPHLMFLCDSYSRASELSLSYRQKLLKRRLAVRSGFTSSAQILCDERAHIYYDMIRLQKYLAAIGRGRALHISNNFIGLTAALSPHSKTTMIEDFRQQSRDANIMYVMSDSGVRIAASFRQNKHCPVHEEHSKIVHDMAQEYSKFEKTVREIASKIPREIPDGPRASDKVINDYLLYTHQMAEFSDQLAKMTAQRAENGINAIFTGDAMWLDIADPYAPVSGSHALSVVERAGNNAWMEQRREELIDTEIYLQRAVILENRARSLRKLVETIEDLRKELVA